MEIISINIVQMEFIVQLSTVKTNAVAWLDTLGIVISLMRGVGWPDVEIKTIILEITRQHGYFIKLPCVVSDRVSFMYECMCDCMYFILDYRCTKDTFHCGVEILPFVGAGESGWLKLTTHHQKKLGFILLILYCDAVNFITMYHYTCEIQTTSQCMSWPVLGLHAFSVMYL